MDERELTGRQGGTVSRRQLLAATGAAGAGLFAGCSSGGDGSDGSSGGTAAGDWRSMGLTTVRGEESFTLGGLETPIIVESFAVWCPACEQQAAAIDGLQESFTVVSLNTDPHEDAETVREYADGEGFDWRFAVAPTALTDALIDEFGTAVTNAPSTPIIVDCGGKAEFLSGEILPGEEVAAVAEDC